MEDLKDSVSPRVDPVHIPDCDSDRLGDLTSTPENHNPSDLQRSSNSKKNPNIDSTQEENLICNSESLFYKIISKRRKISPCFENETVSEENLGEDNVSQTALKETKETCSTEGDAPKFEKSEGSATPELKAKDFDNLDKNQCTTNRTNRKIHKANSSKNNDDSPDRSENNEQEAIFETDLANDTVQENFIRDDVDNSGVSTKDEDDIDTSNAEHNWVAVGLAETVNVKDTDNTDDGDIDTSIDEHNWASVILDRVSSINLNS